MGWKGVRGGKETQEGEDICAPMVNSCWCMSHSKQYCKAIMNQLKQRIIKKKEGGGSSLLNFKKWHSSVTQTRSGVRFALGQSLTSVWLCGPMDCSPPGSSVLYSLLKSFMSTESLRLSNPSHPLLPLSFLPSIFLSTRVFSNESALCIRWPEYWRFSFGISPSNGYSGLISFRTDWFDLMVQRLSRVFSSTAIQNHQFFSAQHSFWCNSQIHTWLLEKP